jgi:hypothetical protein
MKNKSATEKMAEAWNKVADPQEPQQTNNNSSAKNNITFSFLLQIEVVEQMREIEAIKRKTDFYYTVSDVVREGIDIMRKKYKNLPVRPEGLLPTRRGKHSNSTKKDKVFTSCRITEQDREFIYDFMFSKNINQDGEFINVNFTKDDFMETLLKDFKANLKM